MGSAGAGARVAERLYYDSAELEFAARVTDIRLVATEPGVARDSAQVWQVALDRTAFYPDSGGQPWDTGVLIATARSGAVLEVPVERVEEDEAGEVWHSLRKPLVEGAEVTGRVDAQRRRDHMQQHSGQHLLSAVFLELLGARTVSFHLGAESSTIDLAMPEGVESIAAADVERVERRVNELIFENRPLTPRWRTRAEAEAMLGRGELRKLPQREGPMRVVEMHGVEFNACGGTHVASTGAIGGLLVRRLEKVKQGWRVEFVCGMRAVRTARRDYELLTGVAGSLSVGAQDVPCRVAALQDENRAAAKQRKLLMEELAEASAAELVRSAEFGGVVSVVYAGKPVEFAKRVASELGRAGRAAVVGAENGADGAVVLALSAGDARNAGALLREVLATFGARGGGSADLAQGVCDGMQIRDVVAALRSRIS